MASVENTNDNNLFEVEEYLFYLKNDYLNGVSNDVKSRIKSRFTDIAVVDNGCQINNFDKFLNFFKTNLLFNFKKNNNNNNNNIKKIKKSKKNKIEKVKSKFEIDKNGNSNLDIHLKNLPSIRDVGRYQNKLISMIDAESINRKDNNGLTSCHHLMNENNTNNDDVLFVLLILVWHYKANVRIYNENGKSILEQAIEQKRPIEIIMVLILFGADISTIICDEKSEYYLLKQRLVQISNVIKDLKIERSDEFIQIFKCKEAISPSSLYSANSEIIPFLNISEEERNKFSLLSTSVQKSTKDLFGKSGPNNQVRQSFYNDVHHVFQIRESFCLLTNLNICDAGCNATVVKGLYLGINVAVKKFRKDIIIANIFKELSAIVRIGDGQSVCKTYGLYEDKDFYYLVMEQCKQSLFGYMNGGGDNTWNSFFSIAIQAMNALAFIHDKDIIHRDFKSANLLFRQNGKLVIADFGLTRSNTISNEKTLESSNGTWAYMSNDAYTVLYTQEADIFSVSIVFWELLLFVLCGKYVIPYMVGETAYLHQKKVGKGLRLAIPNSGPNEIRLLLNSMWDGEPGSRPNCSQVISSLINIQNVYMDQTNKTHWDSIVNSLNDQVRTEEGINSFRVLVPTTTPYIENSNIPSTTTTNPIIAENVDEAQLEQSTTSSLTLSVI